MLERPGRAILLSAAVLLGAPVVAAAPLSRLSPDEFSLLTERLRQSGSYKVRIQAALLLGSAGGSDAFPALVSALKNDSSGSVRAAAALGLGSLGDERAYGPLIEALVEPDRFVRAQLGRALVQLAVGPEGGMRLWAAMQGAPEASRMLGVHLLASLEANGVPALLVASGDPSGELAAAAKDELVRLPGAQLTAGLRLALALRDPQASAAAATMLADRLDGEALPLLADAAIDPHQPASVRLAARSALMRLSDSISLRAETRRYLSSDPHERLLAVVLITAKSGDDAQDLLIEALDDDDVSVVAEAVNGLAEVGDVDALSALHAIEGQPPPIGGLVQNAMLRIERTHLSRSELRR